MDKAVSRAVSLGAALFFLQNVPYHMTQLLKLTEWFNDYIQYGQWPKEAAYGSEAVEAKAFLSSSREAGREAGEEEGREEG